VAREQLRLAGSELSQARERFTAGVAGNIDVITAQRALIRARDTEIDARFAAATARISWRVPPAWPGRFINRTHR